MFINHLMRKITWQKNLLLTEKFYFSLYDCYGQQRKPDDLIVCVYASWLQSRSAEIPVCKGQGSYSTTAATINSTMNYTTVKFDVCVSVKQFTPN